MNRNQFLTLLKQQLSHLPEEETADILSDYNEHFEIGLSEGKTEEEISGKLGSPQNIAKDLLFSNSIGRVERNPNAGNMVKVIIASISVSLFNLIIVLGPAVALAGILIAGWAACFAFVTAPLMQGVGYLLFGNSFYAFEFFISIALCGFGILLAYGMYFASRWSAKAFIKYCKWNLSIVRGGAKHA